MEKSLKDIELFLFDMDGTLYLGDNVYEGAIELMNDLPKLGKKYIYLTNNSSRAGTDYITRLRRLGFPCESTMGIYAKPLPPVFGRRYIAPLTAVT